MMVEVCGSASTLGMAWPTGASAELTRLEGSAGLKTTATHGDLTLGYAYTAGVPGPQVETDRPL